MGDHQQLVRCSLSVQCDTIDLRFFLSHLVFVTFHSADCKWLIASTPHVILSFWVTISFSSNYLSVQLIAVKVECCNEHHSSPNTPKETVAELIVSLLTNANVSFANLTWSCLNYKNVSETTVCRFCSNSACYTTTDTFRMKFPRLNLRKRVRHMLGLRRRMMSDEYAYNVSQRRPANATELCCEWCSCFTMFATKIAV